MITKLPSDLKVCASCDGMQEMDEQPCTECLGEGTVPKTEEDLHEEEVDRMLNAADAKYERDHDK